MGRIAAVKLEGSWCRPAELSRETGRKSRPFAVDDGAGLPEQFPGHVVSAKLHSDGLQQPVGMGFNAPQFRVLKEFVDRDSPVPEKCRCRPLRPGRTAAPV